MTLKKNILLFVFIIQIYVSGQTYKIYLDSINHKNWQSISPNLDSLDEVKFEKIPPLFKDTILINTSNNDVVETEEKGIIPITPFVFIKNNPEKKWFFYEQNSLMINQSSYSNWNSGGNDNIGAIARINYNMTYKNKKKLFRKHLIIRLWPECI